MSCTEALQGDQARVDLEAQWRGFARLVGETPEGGPITNLGKMRAALRVHAGGTPLRSERKGRKAVLSLALARPQFADRARNLGVVTPALFWQEEALLRYIAC